MWCKRRRGAERPRYRRVSSFFFLLLSSSSLARRCLGAKTDEVPTSTSFWGRRAAASRQAPDKTASSLLRRGSRFDSPIAARGERRERAVRPATEPMRACPKVRYKSMRAHAASDLNACARQTCSVSRSDKLPAGPHLCGHPFATSLPKGQAQRSIQIDGSRVPCVLLQSQATSTDLFFGAGSAPGRLQYDRVSTWCTLAGLSLGLLGSRAPSTTYNLSRQLLSLLPLTLIEGTSAPRQRRRRGA